jgi:hypothetical protein
MDPLTLSTVASNWAGVGSGVASVGSALGIGGGDGMSQKAAMRLQHRYDIEARQANRRDYKRQVQWRVQDAEKAGIHPLAALGIAPYNAGAVNTVGIPPSSASTMSKLGQNLSRASQAFKDVATRKYEMRLLEAQVKTAEAEAGIRMEELNSIRARTRGDQVPPGPYSLGTDGKLGSFQTTDANIDLVPRKRTASDPGHEHYDAGSGTMYTYHWDGKGLRTALSPDRKQSVEDSFPEIIDNIELIVAGSDKKHKPRLEEIRKYAPTAIDSEFVSILGPIGHWVPVYTKKKKYKGYKKGKLDNQQFMDQGGRLFYSDDAMYKWMQKSVKPDTW